MAIQEEMSVQDGIKYQIINFFKEFQINVNICYMSFDAPRYSSYYYNWKEFTITFDDFEDEILAKEVMHKLTTGNNFKDEMVYLQCDAKITGINLEMFQFFNFNKNEILELISNRSKLITNDLDGSIYQQFYKIFPTYHHLKRHMVTLFV